MALYIQSVVFARDMEEAGWPFNLPVFRGLERIELTAPVTILVGENGSGKSTLLETLAVALKLPSIGRADAHRDATLAPLAPFSNSLKFKKGGLPKAKFFLRSEDFFGFVQRLQTQSQELREDLNRVNTEYAGRSAFTQNQARMAYTGSLHALTERYGEDMLSAASHGESFLRLFRARMVPGGLYLLDEPESPLSPLRQLALLNMIDELARENDCQFIMATHSPILAAIPGAVILNCDAHPVAPARYDDLESITLLKDFLQNPQRMIGHMRG